MHGKSGNMVIEEQERWTAMTKQQIAFYASTPAYKSILAVHGWEDLGP